MKRSLIFVLTLALTLVFAPSWATEGPPSADSEHAAIEKAARDYIEGWYDGDVERMTRALHPDLAKRTAAALPSGRQALRTITYNTMIEYTKAGFGKQKNRPNQVNTVTILDVSPVTASVKTISYEYIDYLHLAKVNGEWRIVNVLWEPNPKTAG